MQPSAPPVACIRGQPPTPQPPIGVRHPALSADLHQPAVLLVEAHDVQQMPPLPHRAFPFFPKGQAFRCEYSKSL